MERPQNVDVACAGALSLGLFAIYLAIGVEFLGPLVTHHMTVVGADSEAVIALLAGYEDFAFKTGRHPLVLILLNPFGTLLAVLLGSDDLAALVMNAGCAASMSVLFFALLRRLRLRSVDALLFTALLGLSSSHLVMGSIPETFIFTGFSVLILISIQAFAVDERAFWFWFAPFALFSFGMAVSSLAPISVVLWIRYRGARFSKRVMVVAAANVGAVVAAVPLALLQGALYQNSVVFFRESAPFTLLGDFISFGLFTEPIAHLSSYLPALVTENVIARRGIGLGVINFDGYVSGDHLGLWIHKSGDELLLARASFLALALLALVRLWRGRAWEEPLFKTLGFYFLYSCVFHLSYAPHETFVLSPLFTFSWLGILATSFVELGERQLALGRAILAVALASIAANNLAFALEAIERLNRWLAQNPTL